MRFVEIELFGQYRLFESQHLRTNGARFVYQLTELSFMSARVVCGFNLMIHAPDSLRQSSLTWKSNNAYASLLAHCIEHVLNAFLKNRGQLFIHDLFICLRGG